MPDGNFPVAVPLEITKHSATPAAPAVGTLAVYPKTDDNLYLQTSAGVESQVGGGNALYAFFMGC